MNLLDLKGVGPKTLSKFERLNIFSIGDLLSHYPSRYIDRRKRLKIIDLKLVEDTNYHSLGIIRNLKKVFLPGKRLLVNGYLEDDTGNINVTWFNNPYITVNFKDGDKVVFSGDIYKGKVSNPKLKKLDLEENNDWLDENYTNSEIDIFGKLESIYPETRGLKSYQLSAYITDALQRISDKDFKDILPKKVVSTEKLIGGLEAIFKIHLPKGIEDIKEARERLGFEEIYKILKEINKRKRKLKQFSGPKVNINTTTHEEIVSRLSFALTESQQDVLNEIFRDFGGNKPMNRLLNGDVGSGKTIVAALASWQVINNGMQSILVAPTAVLANQHYQTFKSLFGEQVPIHLITSDTRKEVENLKKDLAEDRDTNDIFIGTHALFHHLDLFSRVGFIVIDEQHKFGVEQRELLTKISTTEDFGLFGNNETLPHVLSMSATPIPRSLALTLFGDMDVSFLTSKPKGRKKIITKCIYDAALLEKMYQWIGDEIKKENGQVYVICPLIKDSEKMDMKSVLKEFENLKEKYPDFSTGLLYGKLKPKEKDEVIKNFIDGNTNILVSTSVVEVGIDNPNATVMIIESAERFGLAQLHQIRGRVGRSDKQSYCFLKTSDNLPNERLEFFANTEDGFSIAEYDLKQRGPGEVYGTLQSGVPNLKIADILDIDLIKRVKKYFK